MMIFHNTLVNLGVSCEDIILCVLSSFFIPFGAHLGA